MANAEYEHREVRINSENDFEVQEDGIVTPRYLEVLRDAFTLGNLETGQIEDLIKSHLRLWKKVGVYREATGLDQEGMS